MNHTRRQWLSAVMPTIPGARKRKSPIVKEPAKEEKFWSFGSYTVRAHTKSEARAKIKRLMGAELLAEIGGRIPGGCISEGASEGITGEVNGEVKQE